MYDTKAPDLILAEHCAFPAFPVKAYDMQNTSNTTLNMNTIKNRVNRKTDKPVAIQSPSHF